MFKRYELFSKECMAVNEQEGLSKLTLKHKLK